jgi:hypothetical protein
VGVDLGSLFIAKIGIIYICEQENRESRTLVRCGQSTGDRLRCMRTYGDEVDARPKVKYMVHLLPRESRNGAPNNYTIPLKGKIL